MRDLSSWQLLVLPNRFHLCLIFAQTGYDYNRRIVRRTAGFQQGPHTAKDSISLRSFARRVNPTPPVNFTAFGGKLKRRKSCDYSVE
jgi:hypothetical protein